MSGVEPDPLPTYPQPLGGYKSKPFQARAIRGQALPPVPIIDGAAGIGFHPSTLVVATWNARAETDVDEKGNTSPAAVDIGATSFQLMGAMSGVGWYTRRFTLGAWRSEMFDVSMFTDVRLTILRSNLVGFAAGGFLTSAPPNTVPRSGLLFVEEYATAGSYVTPPGASSVIPGLADAGFAWNAGGVATPFTIADAMAAGTEREVKGPAFTTTAAPWSAVWRIER